MSSIKAVVAVALVSMGLYPVFNELMSGGADDGTCDCEPCPPCTLDNLPAIPECDEKPCDCGEVKDNNLLSCPEVKPVVKRTPCNCEKDCGTKRDVSASHKVLDRQSSTNGKLPPPAAYMDVQYDTLRDYWSVYHNLLPQAAQSYRAYESNGKGLFIDRDLGGWNNIRMGYEVQTGLAYRYRRTFSMPIKRRFYLVENAGAIDIFNYWDRDHFTKVMPTEDPMDPEGENVYKVPKEYQILEGPGTRKYLNTLPSEKNWFFPESTRMFAQYTEHEEFYPLEEYVRLMHRAFRIKEHLVRQAIEHLTKNGLKPYQYNAMHVRRNDFQYKEIRHAPIQAMYNKVRVYIKDEPLLIISDEYNQDLVDLMGKSASRVVMWKCEGKCHPDQLSIDMLSAVPAKRFFGSPLSTFSGGIQQWRNRCRPNTQLYNTVEYTYDLMRLPIWGRPGETRIEAVGGTFEDIGYERVLVHPEVQKILEEFYQDDRVPFVDEYVPGGHIKNTKKNLATTVKVMSASIKSRLDLILRPIVEQWSKMKVHADYNMHGLRKYSTGSQVDMHVAKSEAHVFSVLMNVRSNTKKPWTVQIRNRHTGEIETVTVGPDHMLLYAGRACEHGRLEASDGEVINAYAHYAPSNRDDCIVGNCQYCGTADECSLPEPLSADSGEQ
eukprot:m.921944 g.921944  ORF g.921944 m.921944 type:complete len:660 (+) comp23757_c0_seq63:204-2183(+)